MGSVEEAWQGGQLGGFLKRLDVMLSLGVRSGCFPCPGEQGQLASKADRAQDLKCIVQSIWAAGGATTSENQQLASFLSWQVLKP